MIEYAVSGAVLAFVVFCALFTPPGRRTLSWVKSQYSSDVEVSNTRLSDFVALTTFVVTVVGIAVSYGMLYLQNRKDNLEGEFKSLTEQKASLEQRIQASGTPSQSYFAPDVDVHLESPAADAAVIHDRAPDLQWQYARHTERVNYVVEVLKPDSDNEDGPETAAPTCDFGKYRRCRFYASDPTSQQSEIPMKRNADDHDRSVSGQFLWRVVPAKSRSASSTPTELLDFAPLSEWSEYRAFSVYPRIIDRITRRREVIVGTTYADNVHFSSIDGHGHYRGFDLDLVELLLDGCIRISGTGTEKGLIADAGGCEKAVGNYREAVRNHAEYVPPDSSPIRIKAFTSVDSGLSALRRKEIDLFIGALTRARERQTPGVIFTRGYYPFKTVLYAHAKKDLKLKQWAEQSRSIGVIENSTNHWLASALTGEPIFGARITITPFPSYANLKSAFVRRDIDAVLIDSVLGASLMNEDTLNVSKIAGLESSHAWDQYHKRLGCDSEEFAIAVGVDPGTAPDDGAMHRVLRFVGLQPARSGPVTLYEAISKALDSDPIEKALRDELRQGNGIEDEVQETFSDKCRFEP